MSISILLFWKDALMRRSNRFWSGKIAREKEGKRERDTGFFRRHILFSRLDVLYIVLDVVVAGMSYKK